MKRKFASITSLILTFSSLTFSQTDTTGVELRKPRQWGISGEVGMNSLSSLIGPVVTFYAKPQLALDFGAGISTSGIRPGVRARYLFTREKTAYYGGVGFKYGLGTGGQEVKVQDPDTKVDLYLTTDKSAFMDILVGVDFMADNGFLVLANLGWSQLLTDKPYTITSGVASDQAKKVFNLEFGSGLMLSVSLGKAF